MRTSHYLVCLLMVIGIWRPAWSQSIYAGGNGDGFAAGSVAQPDNVLLNIYSGGVADGFSFASVAQPDNVLFDIYKGGIGDGFAFGSFAQPDNVLFDIYKGGTDDGFAFASFAQPDNVLFDIYKGGTDDGFAFSGFAQPDNVLYDIYKGGIADGFAFGSLGSLGGEIPLPIELLSFEARYLSPLVYVRWQTASELNNDHFVLEKSRNSVDFLPIYKVNGAGTTRYKQTYSFSDESPFNGINYYRLQQVDMDQHVTYSEVISVLAGGNSPSALYVIPNPSDAGASVSLWISGVGEGTPAQVTIINMMGQTVGAFAAEINSENRININRTLLPEMMSGVYVVTVKVNGNHFTARWAIR